MIKMTKTKICTTCKKEKPFAAFHKSLRGKNGLASRCRECSDIYYKKYRQTHRVEINKSIRRWQKSPRGRKMRQGQHLRITYGLTLGQYDEMFEEQNGVCAMCSNISTEGRRLHVDHNHKTGKIRGLLCYKCNTRLGVLENEKIVNDAKKYLKDYG